MGNINQPFLSKARTVARQRICQPLQPRRALHWLAACLRLWRKPTNALQATFTETGATGITTLLMLVMLIVHEVRRVLHVPC